MPDPYVESCDSPLPRLAVDGSQQARFMDDSQQARAEPVCCSGPAGGTVGAPPSSAVEPCVKTRRGCRCANSGQVRRPGPRPPRSSASAPAWDHALRRPSAQEVASIPKVSQRLSRQSAPASQPTTEPANAPFDTSPRDERGSRTGPTNTGPEPVPPPTLTPSPGCGATSPARYLPRPLPT